MNNDVQLTLPHSAEYLRQRQQVLQQLMFTVGKDMQFNGRPTRIGDLIAEVLKDSELGQRLVWQSTLDTRVQL